MRTIFSLLLLCGVAVVIEAQFRQARAVALWSDFKMFEKRASELENGKEVLSLGGEDESSNLKNLLDNLWSLGDPADLTLLGLIVIVLSGIGLAFDCQRSRPPVSSRQPTTHPVQQLTNA